MCGNARQRALAFLLGAHLLTVPEAEEALAVAAGVLQSGLATLTAAAGARDGPAVLESAHGLKGNLLNLGLAELAQTAEHALDMARQGDFDTAAAAGQALSRALAPLLLPCPD
ncbi:MAG TPA: hypothetical protein VN436_00780 [Holophaga sp.]|nr:hypothetical protein [Holophaga sp.]